MSATEKRFSAACRRPLRATVCILAALVAAAAVPAFSADGDKDYEKGDFAWDQGDVDTAIKFYLKAADVGHLEAQRSLAIAYEKKGDLEEAFKWSRKAAEGGDIQAQFDLGFRYINGKGVEQNAEEGVKWVRKCAERGYRAGQTAMGLFYHGGRLVAKDEAEAAKWYLKAMKQDEGDDPTTPEMLGHLYLKGAGVPKDEKEAFRLFKIAAARGNKDAQYEVGACYLFGRGTEENKFTAYEWLKGLLDWMIEKSNDGDIDVTLGLAEFFSIAARIHTVEAETLDYDGARSEGQRGLLDLQRSVYLDSASKAAHDAVTAYRRAAASGEALAQYALAECFMNGRGTEKDEEEAVKRYLKAADAGIADAQFGLAKCYRDGKGVAKDQAEADKWMKKAADNGSVLAQWALVNSLTDEKEVFKLLKVMANHKLTDGRNLEERSAIVIAQYRLAKAYAEGNGTADNENEAFKWYKIVSDHDETDILIWDAEEEINDAQFNLGMCYEKGWGVAKNQQAAIQWYRISAMHKDYGQKAQDALKRLGYNTNVPGAPGAPGAPGGPGGFGGGFGGFGG